MEHHVDECGGSAGSRPRTGIWRSDRSRNLPLTLREHFKQDSFQSLPRPVMAVGKLCGHGHCGPEGSMVSDHLGSQCPVGSPPTRKGLRR